MSNARTIHSPISKQLGYLGLVLVALLCVGGASCLMLRSHSVSQVFVFDIYSLSALALSSYLFSRLIKSLATPAEKVRLFLLTILAALIGAILLEALTVYGSPKGTVLSLHCWSKKRIIFFFALSLIGYLSIRVFLQSNPSKNKTNGSYSNRLKSLGAPFALSATIALAFFFLISHAFGNGSLAFFLFPFAAVFSVCALFDWHRFGFSTESLYLAIALPFGLATAICIPVTTGLSFDDQIHYSNALDTSYVFTSQRTDTDIHFSEIAVLRSLEQDVMPLTDWSSEKVWRAQIDLDVSYRSDINSGHVLEFHNEPIFTLSSLGYIPSAIGLWLARIIGLGFCHTVILGRVFNLLAFIFTIFAAIKITPAKKTLFLMVGLIPTNIFLASNYSYDPWLISMVALGLAMLYKKMWSDEALFPAKAIPSLGICSLGIAVKATYFPILGLFLLMPKNKFKTRKQHVLYCATVIAAAAILLASFVVPFLFAGSSNAGDTRGGEGVNPMGQVSYILNNMTAFCSMLAHFLASTYFDPSQSPSILLEYAYLGEVGAGYINTPWVYAYGWIPFFALLTCAIVDGNRSSAKTAGCWQSAWSVVLFFASLALIATALYVSFTPVGNNTVNGCQTRYILPLLIPALTCIFNNKCQSLLGDGKTRAIFTSIAVAEITACSFLLIVPRFIA